MDDDELIVILDPEPEQRSAGERAAGRNCSATRYCGDIRSLRAARAHIDRLIAERCTKEDDGA